jgi:hypothetical protein
MDSKLNAFFSFKKMFFSSGFFFCIFFPQIACLREALRQAGADLRRDFSIS